MEGKKCWVEGGEGSSQVRLIWIGWQRELDLRMSGDKDVSIGFQRVSG